MTIKQFIYVLLILAIAIVSEARKIEITGKYTVQNRTIGEKLLKVTPGLQAKSSNKQKFPNGWSQLNGKAKKNGKENKVNKSLFSLKQTMMGKITKKKDLQKQKHKGHGRANLFKIIGLGRSKNNNSFPTNQKKKKIADSQAVKEQSQKLSENFSNHIYEEIDQDYLAKAMQQAKDSQRIYQSDQKQHTHGNSPANGTFTRSASSYQSTYQGKKRQHGINRQKSRGISNEMHYDPYSEVKDRVSVKEPPKNQMPVDQNPYDEVFYPNNVSQPEKQSFNQGHELNNLQATHYHHQKLHLPKQKKARSQYLERIRNSITPYKLTAEELQQARQKKYKAVQKQGIR